MVVVRFELWTLLRMQLDVLPYLDLKIQASYLYVFLLLFSCFIIVKGNSEYSTEDMLH